MMRSLFSGVSGLANNTIRMDVIGNNVANVNTIAYKASRVTFEETMTQMLKGATAPLGTLGGSNPTQVGTGARLGTIDSVFTQGSMEATGIDTDLGIQGRAFFVLSDGANEYFTRSGSFQLDGNGHLVNPSNGYTLQGFAFNRATDQFENLATAIKLPLGEVEPAKATGTLSFRGNLDADSEPRGTKSNTAIMYGADGNPVTAETKLDDVKGDPGGVIDLLGTGDSITFSGTVGGMPVGSTVSVGAATSMGDLLNAIETSLNAVEGVDGITVGVDSNGRIQVATPDGLGKKGEVSGLVIQAQDSQNVPRDDFNGLVALTDTQAARDAGVFVEESTIYDSLGFSHVVRTEFTRLLGANQFSWKATVDGGTTPILQGGTGKVTFNGDGSFNGFFFDAAGDIIPTALSISPTTGARTPLELNFDPGTPGGFAGMTLVRASSTLEATSDGFSKGTATDFRIDRTGTVMSIFSNGVTRPVGKIALSDFVNPAGLVRYGDNMFQASTNSGKPLIGQAGGSVEATINSGSLEQSNVDLAREFTNMILAQRGFQASARVITSSDEVLTELLNLKR
jgi:flagellar hook protein FlgE